jgi:hypothetical protein
MPSRRAGGARDTSPSPLLGTRILADLYRLHFKDERRERLFLASVAFLITFASVRLITTMIRAGTGPFHNITAGTTHIHHLVWGIVVLLIVGYVWLFEVGVTSGWVASLTALAFGVGAALTLDEFALWLNLEDDYWTKQGRESIDAVALFGALLALSVLGKGFAKDAAKLPAARSVAPR